MRTPRFLHVSYNPGRCRRTADKRPFSSMRSVTRQGPWRSSARASSSRSSPSAWASNSSSAVGLNPKSSRFAATTLPAKADRRRASARSSARSQGPWMRVRRRETSPGGALRQVAEHWLIPLLFAALLLVGISGRVRVYESMVAGAREGLDVVVRIVPYLVAILVAVAMFRASGALDLLIAVLDPITSRVGFPAEALPMALMRPLSGSGALGVMAEILEVHGPDSFVGMLTSTLMGSTETTFYVLTIYCGAAGVRDVRHALPCCLIGDLAGAIGATAACHLFFG